MSDIECKISCVNTCEFSNRLPDPIYYHRQYEHDFPQTTKEEENQPNVAQRVAITALPFLSLYKPFGTIISWGMNLQRSYTCTQNLLGAKSSGDSQSKAVVQTILAITALVGTVFSHPFCMIITTGHDIFINGSKILKSIGKEDYTQSIKDIAQLANNAFYLGTFFLGGPSIIIASFAVQCLLEGYNSLDEFKEGHHIEAIGHLGMSMIRGSQCHSQIQMQRSLSLSAKNIEAMEIDSLKELEDDFDSQFQEEMMQDKRWHPALELLEELYPEQINQCYGSFSENFHYSEDASGNINAIWLCENADWNFTMRSAFYNAKTKT